MDKAIILENLSKQYKNNRGITDINLEVDRGEIFGFLGPNGAGKTTAMKIMTGLMAPDRGEVKINGFSVFSQYEKAMEQVGCIIENVCPVPYMTCLLYTSYCWQPCCCSPRVDRHLQTTMHSLPLPRRQETNNCRKN